MLQTDEMDESLRIGVYNELYDWLDLNEAPSLCEYVWTVFWHMPKDGFREAYDFDYSRELKGRILFGAWYEVYDLIEAIAKRIAEDDRVSASCQFGGDYPYLSDYPDFRKAINEVLKREGSAYQLVGESVVAISSEVELSEISAALEASDKYSGAKAHLRKALDHLSKKPNGDFENSIKESVFAVESAASSFDGVDGNTLGKSLGELREKGVVHPALADGWSRIYGFACDEGGIRHAHHEDAGRVDYALAKYLLVASSAFVNYLICLEGGVER